MTQPTRIQRRRTKGWRSEDHSSSEYGARYVGRGSKWGNPWAVVRQADGMYGIPNPTDHLASWPTFYSETEARAEAVRLFELHIGPLGLFEYDAATLAALRADLGGRDLMCWCPLPEPGQPDHCHAEVLLKLANAPLTAV